MLPNFIIAGAEKSGTSSLSFYLSEHPDIYVPAVKEQHFFDKKENYKKGLDWYQKQFDGWNGEKAAGECTPFYMYDEECPLKIIKGFPEIKIIFILRNPVDRAYSNYWHQVQGGKELHCFETALKIEKKRIKKSRYHNFTYSYIQKGFYSVQIERFLKFFKADQILILKFEELKNNPQKVMNKMYSFLGVELIENQNNIGNVKNKSVLPASKLVQFAAREVFGKTILFKAIAKANLIFGEKEYPPMKEDTRKMLVDFYSKDVEKLENISGLSFESWKL